MTMSEDLLVDPETLREQVRDKYREVAVDPHRTFHFHTGRPLAARLGYERDAVDALPDRAVESFAGVGNPFSLRRLEPEGAENWSRRSQQRLRGRWEAVEFPRWAGAGRVDGVARRWCGVCWCVQAAGRYSLMIPPHTVWRSIRSAGRTAFVWSGARWCRERWGRWEL